MSAPPYPPQGPGRRRAFWQSGQDYGTVKPTYAIWLLGEELLPGDPHYAHRLRLRDERGRCLLDHGGIYL